MKYVITGGKQLNGKIRVSGNKNSVFPCIAAALLTDEEVILENVSHVLDSEVLIQIVKKLGVSVKVWGSTVKLRAVSIRHHTLPENLVTKLRGSIVLVGALLSRVGKVKFWHPGGDVIGQRSIEVHLAGFKALGADIKKSNLAYLITYGKKASAEVVDIFLREASVTATENLILASVLGKNVVILRNCAKEPHIIDLCKLLAQMGAEIHGIGGDTLKIMGVDRLSGTKFAVGMDYVEVGTYMIAAAITGSKLEIEGIDETEMNPVFMPLKAFGIRMEHKDKSIIVWADRLKSPDKLTTNIWPGFPTDLMSVVMVLATQCKGVILCHDWLYESRMFFVDKLISMGASIILADPHRVLIYGATKLKGRVLDTPDIRAGMALVLAALVAKGISVINQSELIERGYEDVVGKFTSLGADIKSEI